MNKTTKLIKNIIWIVGIIFAGIIILINLLFDARLANDLSEHVTIKFIGILNLIITGLIAVVLYFLFKKVQLIE